MRVDTMTTMTTAAASDDARVMTLLQEHVPLALLCDLTVPEGPASREIFDTEGGPAQRWWE